MDTATHTERLFGTATYDVLVGNLEGAIAFNASPQLIAQLVNEIALREDISDRHMEFANSLPDVVGYLAYLEARQNGYSHISAADLAWKAGK